jgi:hypothetical protein
MDYHGDYHAQLTYTATIIVLTSATIYVVSQITNIF